MLLKHYPGRMMGRLRIVACVMCAISIMSCGFRQKEGTFQAPSLPQSVKSDGEGIMTTKIQVIDKQTLKDCLSEGGDVALVLVMISRVELQDTRPERYLLREGDTTCWNSNDPAFFPNHNGITTLTMLFYRLSYGNL
ncbi:MAG: hypothetical protein HY399_01190 [Elusimicrobia bacterium]|nr:hypothetical protein [Elusimicrobiota bacterium]